MGIGEILVGPNESSRREAGDVLILKHCKGFPAADNQAGLGVVLCKSRGLGLPTYRAIFIFSPRDDGDPAKIDGRNRCLRV